jgi:hypothetical protein
MLGIREIEEKKVQRNRRDSSTWSKVPPVFRQHSLIRLSYFKRGQNGCDGRPDGAKSHVSARTDSKRSLEEQV